MVAGHDGDILRGAEPFEEGVGLRKFCWKRKIDQVTGDRDMVDGLRLEIRDDAVEHGGEVKMPAPLVPVDEAADAFAHEIEQTRCRQRRKMRVRQMRQHETRHSTQSNHRAMIERARSAAV